MKQTGPRYWIAGSVLGLVAFALLWVLPFILLVLAGDVTLGLNEYGAFTMKIGDGAANMDADAIVAYYQALFPMDKFFPIGTIIDLSAAAWVGVGAVLLLGAGWLWVTIRFVDNYIPDIAVIFSVTVVGVFLLTILVLPALPGVQYTIKGKAVKADCPPNWVCHPPSYTIHHLYVTINPLAFSFIIFWIIFTPLIVQKTKRHYK